ncbi:hypothetical protein F4780DRAFT_13291 [Xylariomycetidae sp. FL0641]|nr:hypothetical protein F4780DRAFT_13291 [Xylariomycetidae sp. FL0641]
MGEANDNGKASDLDRRASTRTSTRLSNNLPEDDEFALMAMGISDGFRPVEVAQNHTSSHVQRPSISSLEPPSARAIPPRPSSVSKPHHPHDSFSLRHDGTSADPTHEPVPTRASAASSNTPFMSAEAPYEGPSGPSHPYQMYPQNVRLARTASLATTSTVPVSERSYNGPRGPTHPYGMYPQDTAPGVENVDSREAQRQINVGFPGATDNYQRRIGPDGEDVADLIGPDGHTEQLPPYTRYPDETYHRKALGLETPQPAPAQPMLEVPSSIPGAGGIGLATRNPEFSSTEDLHEANSPGSRQSVRSFASETSHHQINAGAETVTDEKQKPLKKWQAGAKRKVWGIVPCWALGLAIVVLLMFGIVLGAVIGTIFGPHLKPPPHDKPPYEAETTITVDATTLSSVPTGLPALEEGVFSLPLMNTRAPNTCFKETTQSRAWDCNIIWSQLSLAIKRVAGPDSTQAYEMDFMSNTSATIQQMAYSYGMQPPPLTNLQLTLVQDLFEPTRGPAWSFEAFYNKTVIVPEEYLSPTTTAVSATTTEESKKRKRMHFGDNFKRKGVAHPGDRPWICLWDQTVLEVFIYAGQNSSFNQPSVSSGSVRVGTSTTYAASEETTGATTTTQTAIVPTAVQRRQEFQGTFGGNRGFPTGSAITETEQVTRTITETSSETTTGGYSSYGPLPTDLYTPYPRVIKMEERRQAGSGDVKPPTPVCRQYELVTDGVAARPVVDENGDYVEVEIAEDEGDYTSESSKRSIIERFLAERDNTAELGNDMSDCGCMWWLT